MIEELYDQDEATHMNTNETEEEVQGECLAFDDNLEFDADIVPTALHSYEDVFCKTAFNTLPERQKWDYAIKLEHDIVVTELLRLAR
jgi:hypothetical protein